MNNTIFTAATNKILHAAESAYRNYMPSFTLWGKRFDIVIIDRRTACVFCDGKDSGIYIEDGAAVLG